MMKFWNVAKWILGCLIWGLQDLLDGGCGASHTSQVRVSKRTENVGVVGWVFWSLFSAIWSSYFGPIVIVMPIEVTPFAWFTLALAGLTVFVARNWDWIYDRTTWGKLNNIAGEVSTLGRILHDHAERAELRRTLGRPVVMQGMSESRAVTSIHAMARILEVHEIPHPHLEKIDEWAVFAAELEAVCRHSWTMKRARELCVDE